MDRFEHEGNFYISFAHRSAHSQSGHDSKKVLHRPMMNMWLTFTPTRLASGVFFYLPDSSSRGGDEGDGHGGCSVPREASARGGAPLSPPSPRPPRPLLAIRLHAAAPEGSLPPPPP